MHFITTLRTNGSIIDYRQDLSVPAYWTEGSLKEMLSDERGVALADIETRSFSTLPSGSFTGQVTPLLHSIDVSSGELKDNPDYVAPATERRWGLEDIMSNVTLLEKAKFLTPSSPQMTLAISEFTSGPKNQAGITEILAMLVDSADISQSSMNKVLA